MKVKKTTLPAMSILNYTYNFNDYTDSYYTLLKLNGNEIQLEDAVSVLLVSSPPWAFRLLHIRNKFASLFGLKKYQLRLDQHQDEFPQDNEGQDRVFRIFFKNRNELIMGTDDRHLNFRVSLLLYHNAGQENKEIFISTVVKFNNFLGRFYFFFVKPFHRRIVPAMLKRMARHYESQTRIPIKEKTI